MTKKRVFFAKNARSFFDLSLESFNIMWYNMMLCAFFNRQKPAKGQAHKEKSKPFYGNRHPLPQRFSV